MMDAKKLGGRLRRVRKLLGLNQQQLAKVTNLTQPAISRMENGEEVYASALLAVLDFYREKICLDSLFDPKLDEDDKNLLSNSLYEACQRIDHQLAFIAQDLEKSKRKIAALRNKL